ncbi:MAG: radical SAM protein [Oscillospiraceae bacterium]|nr:radical SAM protein [Oscillospiraceae bacterium]
MKNIKEQHMDMLSAYVRGLYQKPDLRQLFLELTLQCNEHCFHCGSSCTAAPGDMLTLEEYRSVLEQVKQDFDISRVFLCITGGEPLLRKDFFDIMSYAKQLGYRWGMTTNATLITKNVAARLAECGMATVSVSLDGLRDTHDTLRGLPGGYDLAMRGIQNLIDTKSFQNIQVTTVVNHENIGELDALFEILVKMEIDSWRVINLEPIGRALSWPDRMLTAEDYRTLFSYIREKRLAGYPVEYGCSHYLGPEYEHEVRNWYWLCNAGIYTASIMANGDVGACLDIERRPETIQGNIRQARLRDIWENRFELFRHDLSETSGFCSNCSHAKHCRGGAHHSWDYDLNKPRICFKGCLF